MRSRAHWITIEGWQATPGKDCIIYLEPRGWTCDRGRFLAKLDADGGTELARSLDEADGWPRYYFDEERAKLEIEAWLSRRGQLVEESAEQAKARVLARLDRDIEIVDLVLGALKGKTDG